MEISPFSDECVMAFKKHHWMYMGRRTIVTDVTSRADEPVKHSKELYDYAEHVKRMEAKDRKGELSSKYMTPQSKCGMTWTDIVFMMTLNGEQVRKGADKHIHGGVKCRRC